MKNFTLLFALITVSILTACTNEYSKPVCVADAVDRYEMQDYRGEEIEGCVTFLLQYQWNQEFYFDWENPCIDKISMPTDCAGEPLTVNFSDSTFTLFHLEAEVVGIVGIRRF